MIDLVTSPDFLMALGTCIGIYSKAYALKDSDTVWSRKSSLPNILTYPVTALYPMWILDLYISFTTTLVTLLIWIGIYLFRAPSKENYLGRKD